MKNEWMLDVLADLKRFADLNGMSRLSSELAQTFEIAKQEIVHPVGSARRVPGDERSCGAVPRPVVSS